MASAVVLSDDELLDILENRIPALLERRPDLQRRVYAAWVETFAKREEVAAIIDELRHLARDVAEFREAVTKQFERVDERFGQMDRHLEQVDQRFEQVDQRFEHVEHRLDRLDKKFIDLKDWVELVIGRMQVRSGRNLEDVVAGAMRVALKRPDIKPDQILLRQKIKDTEGIVFPRGRQKEIDLIASNGEYLAFEVKSAAEVDDVENFAEKVELLQHLNPDKQVRGVFITLAPEPDVKERCAELGIELAR